MAMLQATLSAALAGMAPEGDEAVVIASFTAAIEAHTLAATALTPILPAGVALGEAAMLLALVGMTDLNQAATKVQDGLTAWWAAIAGGLTTSFAGATAITPPDMSSIATDLQTAFDANLAALLNLADAADEIATVIHAAALDGGSVTTPGPVSTPII